MIKDIKLGLSVMKYGLNFKVSMLALLICVGMGVVLTFLLPVGIIGCIYIAMGLLFIVQLIYSVSVSTMVQTSPHKKRMQTIVPSILGTLCMLVSNTFAVTSQWLEYQRAMNNTNPNIIIIYEPGEYESGYIFSSFVLVFLLLYTVIAMKYFEVAMGTMIIGCIAFLNLSRLVEINYIIIPEGLAIGLSYAIVLLGGGIMCLISIVSYKKDYSKAAFDSLLKRAK